MDLRTVLTFVFALATLTVTPTVADDIADESNVTFADNVTDVIQEANVTADSPSQSSDKVSCMPVDGSGSTETWCDVNCNHTPRNCPASLCICAGVDDITENDDIADITNESNVTAADNITKVIEESNETAKSPCTIPRKGCLPVDGSGATQTWCDANCPGSCPASHCSCPNDEDYERVILEKLITCIGAQNEMISKLQKKNLHYEEEAQDHKNSIASLETKLNLQENTNSNQKNDISSLETDLNTQKQIISNQGNEINDQKNVIASLKTELNTQRQINSNQETKINNQGGQINSERTKTTRNENEIKSQQNKINQLSACTKPKVAFTANFGTPSTKHLTRDETLKYQHVIRNDNNNYDKNTGVFTAREPGLYMFHVHVLAGDGGVYRYNKAWLQLMYNSNNHPKTTSYVRGAYAAGAMSAALNLNKGDRVWVKQRFSGPDWIILSWGSSFSGFLVRSDKC